MPPRHARSAAEVLTDVLAADRARLVARMVRIVGELDLAEDALQDASIEAIASWERRGIPANPQGWLIAVARRRAIDRIRSAAASQRRSRAWGELAIAWADDRPSLPVPDDRLALIFTCCHPALALDARVALTLRVIGGLATREIAAAFLVSEATMSQRITRAKAKIREAKIAYRVPALDDRPERLEAVRAVIYLIFNAGYLAHTAETAVSADLMVEATALADLLVEQIGDDAEVLGLASLLHLTQARGRSRLTADGQLKTLLEQDRATWDVEEIEQGRLLLAAARRLDDPGPYQLQAAIAAAHCASPDLQSTDWSMIVTLYDGLAALAPSPVVALNRAMAVAMADSPGAARRSRPHRLAGRLLAVPPGSRRPAAPDRPGRRGRRGL